MVYVYVLCMHIYVHEPVCAQGPEKDVRCPAFETRPLSEISWTDDQRAPEITL